MNDTNDKSQLSKAQQTEAEAAAFRRLLAHLDSRKDVQNIDLMILGGFCRNCLSKWYAAAAQGEGANIDYEAAREHIYGMPFAQWKSQYQAPATTEQLQAFNALKQDD